MTAGFAGAAGAEGAAVCAASLVHFQGEQVPVAVARDTQVR